MKKILLFFVLGLSLCFCLVGCGYDIPAESMQPTLVVADSQFEKLTADVGITIFDANDVILYRDKLTDVIYIAYRGRYETALCVMVNSDGTPLLYSEWCTLREASANGN